METKLSRAGLIELVGSFGLVFFSAGLVYINQATALERQTPLASLHQPGITGVAIGQGLILAAMLALTAPITGGFLNPAIALALWVFNRLETQRAIILMGAQLLGGTLAALCLYGSFPSHVVQASYFGAPHVNTTILGQPGQFGGLVVELALTFFLVFAIFGLAGSDPLKLGLVTGMMMTVCALFAFPLTGAALNPARWFGPTVLEAYNGSNLGRSAWADALVYLAGPIIGALLGGFFVFKFYGEADKGKK